MFRFRTAALLAVLAMPLLLGANPSPVSPQKMPALEEGSRILEAINGMPVIFQATFEKDEASHFEPTDPKAWKVVEQQGNHVYALTVRQSNYKPPHRSPYNISLINDIDLGSLALDVRFQSAMTDYNHRSLCLFFNYQDADHFYYVHFGKSADPHANQVFIVNGADRKAISLTTTDGTPWTDAWHHGRVVRNAETGEIAVYFDDMDKPAMTAKDTTFTSGRVGIGSFDDAGNYDFVAVYGSQNETE